MYYPEDDCPFYRCTVFSHYAAKNAPAADAKLPTLRRGEFIACLSCTYCLSCLFILGICV